VRHVRECTPDFCRNSVPPFYLRPCQPGILGIGIRKVGVNALEFDVRSAANEFQRFVNFFGCDTVAVHAGINFEVNFGPRPKAGRKSFELVQTYDCEGDIPQPAADDVLERGVPDDEDGGRDALVAQDEGFEVRINAEEGRFLDVEYLGDEHKPMTVRVALQNRRNADRSVPAPKNVQVMEKGIAVHQYLNQRFVVKSPLSYRAEERTHGNDGYAS